MLYSTLRDQIDTKENRVAESETTNVRTTSSISIKVGNESSRISRAMKTKAKMKSALDMAKKYA